MKCTLPEFLLYTIWQIRFISLSHSYVNSVVDFPTCLPSNDHGKKWKDVAVQGKKWKILCFLHSFKLWLYLWKGFFLPFHLQMIRMMLHFTWMRVWFITRVSDGSGWSFLVFSGSHKIKGGGSARSYDAASGLRSLYDMKWPCNRKDEVCGVI